MKEAVFITELKRSLEMAGAFAHKIADMPHFKGMKTRFDMKKPFDVFVSYKTHPIAIECKMVKGGSFSFENIRDCQIEGLEKFEGDNSNGFSFLIINLRLNQKTMKANRTIILPWKKVKKDMKKRKGYSKEELLDMPYCPHSRIEVEGLKQKVVVYDLNTFLETFD